MSNISAFLMKIPARCWQRNKCKANGSKALTWKREYDLSDKSIEGVGERGTSAPGLCHRLLLRKSSGLVGF